GRHICNELKALRRRIAEENGIPLETEECTYRGECCGTCPRCDAEVRYLEDALSRRLRMGKAAVVAGVALGLAVSTGVKAQNVTDTAALKPVAKEISDTVGKVRVTGVVLNSKTKEPEPFVNVTVNKDGEMIGGAATNMEGKFTILAPSKGFGEYEVLVSAVGFRRTKISINIDKKNKDNVELGDIYLEFSAIQLGGIVVTKKGYPLMDRDPYGAKGYVEYDGVKVIVK
ncbi:MAG: carboxypeptidase-like regulatory domain-containing protein, partial [Bacteroidales bacterium]|nr:carboxypeptidase-like regulatory domain-containing protein [Bacteroidales bacterium]